MFSVPMGRAHLSKLGEKSKDEVFIDKQERKEVHGILVVHVKDLR